MNKDTSEVFRAKVTLETSQIAWRELQRFFAGGMAVFVSAELDLVEVALRMSEDNRTQIEQWLIAGQIGKVSDVQAMAWYKADALVWAVVVRPWVLVQPTDLLH